MVDCLRQFPRYRVLVSVKASLVKIDPDCAGYYDYNAKNYIGKLDALDASIKAAFPTVVGSDALNLLEARKNTPYSEFQKMIIQNVKQ